METKEQTTKVVMHPATLEVLAKRKNFIEVKPYLLKELAMLYGVEPRTLKNWMAPFKSEIGEKMGRYYTVRQVKVIFEKLDVPYLMKVA